VSAGLVGGEPVLDLSYEEDANADVDFNVVMTGVGRLVEIQGTAEGEAFSRDELTALVDLAEAGIAKLTEFQRQVLGG
jgi:ribonuclease PH